MFLNSSGQTVAKSYCFKIQFFSGIQSCLFLLSQLTLLGLHSVISLYVTSIYPSLITFKTFYQSHTDHGIKSSLLMASEALGDLAPDKLTSSIAHLHPAYHVGPLAMLNLHKHFQSFSQTDPKWAEDVGLVWKMDINDGLKYSVLQN